MVDMEETDWVLSDEEDFDDGEELDVSPVVSPPRAPRVITRAQDEPSVSGTWRQPQMNAPFREQFAAPDVAVPTVDSLNRRLRSSASIAGTVRQRRRAAALLARQRERARLSREAVDRLDGSTSQDRAARARVDPSGGNNGPLAVNLGVNPEARAGGQAANLEAQNSSSRNSGVGQEESRRLRSRGRNTRNQPPRRGQPRLQRAAENAARPNADVEAEDIESVDDTDAEVEAGTEASGRRVTRRQARVEGLRPRSTRARARPLEDLLSYSEDESESDDQGQLPLGRGLLERWDEVVNEMEAIFSDEATFSDDDDELQFDEDEDDSDDYLPAINVPGLQRLRVIVEELSNQDMARRAGANALEISSDEDTEEQRREWHRLGLETANERRRAARLTAHSPAIPTQASAPTEARSLRQNNTNDSGDTVQGPTKRSRLEVDSEDGCDTGPGGAAAAREGGKTVADDEDDVQRVAMCSICLDEMHGGGDHRLVVLKCGHCFGESCAKRWLMSGKRSCPMCNRQASLKDMRVVFLDCHRLGVSYELAEARKEINNLLEREQQSCSQVRELNCKVDALNGQNEILIERVRLLENGLQQRQPSSLSHGSRLGNFPKTQYFTRLSGHCKYMAYSNKLALIAVSAKPTASFFEGFSVELCSLYDLKSRRSKLLHTQEIKDLDFHENKPWLLTASLDNTARISGVDNLSLTSIHTAQLHCKVWSCCWNQSTDTNFFLGLSDGNVVEYDVRAPRDPIGTLKGPSANALPVVSLKSFNMDSGRRDIYGLACSQLRNTVRIYSCTGENRYSAHDILAAGNCFSLSHNAAKESLLVTSRTQHAHGVKGVTNELVSLKVRDGETQVTVKSRFQSGGSSSVISKPSLCTSPTGDLWACCLDDNARTIQVFSCDDASLRLTLKTQDPHFKQFTQVEKILLPGRSDYALAGLSEGGLSVFA